jgi:hypothetical protein
MSSTFRLLQSVIVNDDPRWAISHYMELLRHGVEEYANVYLDFHRPSASGDAMPKLAQDGFGEALNGSYTAHLFQTVVARRPE